MPNPINGNPISVTPIPDSALSPTSERAVQNKVVNEAINDLNRQLSDETTGLDTKAPVIVDTASGAIATFTDGADGMPVKKLVATIEPVQSGTGDPSPDNVRPISGWTGVEIVGTGKNLFVTDFEQGAIDSASGLPISNNYRIRSKDFICLKAGTYVFSCKESAAVMICIYSLNKDYISPYGSTPGIVRFIDQPATFTLTEDRQILFTVRTGDTTPITPSDISEVQVEKGSSKTAYELPGNQIPINWQTEAGTIYGGTVTLNEDGSVDVFSDWYSRTFDGDTYYLTSGASKTSGLTDIYECFNYFGSGGLRGIPKGLSPNPAYNLSDKAICRWAKANVTNNDLLQFQDVSNSEYLRMYFNVALLDGITSSSTSAEILAAMRTYFRANPVTIVLKCATGQSYHFPDIGQLYTFFGVNNVWIDTGSITECEYPADTKLYIDSLTAPDEDMIADANIASGQYFTVNNKLYLSTAAIAAGASIVPGTNCTETNLAAALNALNT